MSDMTGITGEHESRGENSGNAGAAIYQPTPEEKKDIKLVERLFEKAKRHRAIYDQKWIDYYQMFRGRQWKEQRPSYRHSEVINFIFRVIQSTVPIQMDSRPKFEFLPQDPSDFELSQIMNMVAEADWTKFGWSEQLLEVVYEANIYGTGMSSMMFDPNLNFKQGEIVYESKDPLCCYPDPDARDVNKKCGFFIYAEPKEVGWIKKQHPEYKDFIKPDLMDLLKSEKNDLQPLRYRSPVDQKVVVEGSNPYNLADKDKALYITCWLTAEQCEDDFEEKEIPGENGAPSTFEQTAKYPEGRKLVICNGVRLEKGPNGYDDGQIPFQRYPNYILPREFWGISEIEQLEGPQKMFNKVFCFALDVLTLMGNPIWLVPDTSGVDPENLNNRPGLAVEYSGDKEPTRAEGVQLQPYVMQIADKLAEWIDSIAGSQDVTRGVQPTGVTAASAISTLQEAAQTRVRQKARNMDVYLQPVGEQYASRVFQFRTAPQIYRLTNSDGSNKYFKMHTEQFDKGDGQMGTKVNYQPLEQNGQMDPMQAKQFELRGKLDVRVSTGSSLPFNKAEKEGKLLNFFDRGIIDRVEVLKGSDYPNWEAVEQRMLDKEAAEAQAAADAEAAKAGPPQAQPAM